MELSTLRRIAARAIQSGGKLHSRHLVEWDVSGRCLDAVTRELTARSPIPREQPNQRTWYSDGPAAGVMRVIMHTRCRKCAECLKHRAAKWRHKAQPETMYAARTWFVTYTFTPDQHFRAEQQARRRLLRSGVDFDKLSPLEQFFERDKELYPLIQLALKRIRKEWQVEHGEYVFAPPLARKHGPRRKIKLAKGNAFRYLVAGEVHTEKLRGYPHYHMLLHETDILRPIRKRMLKGQWIYGHSDAKLVTDGPRAHWYVTKYLTKEASTRIRASFRYGHGVTPSRHKDRNGGVTGEPQGDSGSRGSPHSVETTYNSGPVNGTTGSLGPISRNQVVADIRDTICPKGN